MKGNRHPERGNRRAEHRAPRGGGAPKRRPRRVNARVPEDLYVALRRESDESWLGLSAVMRLALRAALERVSADRTVREAVG